MEETNKNYKQQKSIWEAMARFLQTINEKRQNQGQKNIWGNVGTKYQITGTEGLDLETREQVEEVMEWLYTRIKGT